MVFVRVRSALYGVAVTVAWAHAGLHWGTDLLIPTALLLTNLSVAKVGVKMERIDQVALHHGSLRIAEKDLTVERDGIVKATLIEECAREIVPRFQRIGV